MRKRDTGMLLEENWDTLGLKLKGKLHVIAGAWDNFYLEPAVQYLKDFLEGTDFGGYVEIYPGNHGSFMTRELQERMAQEMADHFTAHQEAFPGLSLRVSLP